MAVLLIENPFFSECYNKLKGIRSNDLFLTELVFYYMTLLKLYKLSKEEIRKITADHFQLTSDFYYLIDVIAVTKKEQKKKAGTTLLKEILKITDSSLPIYSVAWKNIYGINIKKLYKNFNIIPKINLGKIWAHGCNRKFQCPSYKLGCQCKGFLFQLKRC